jgi:hypothetical protein
MLSGKPFSAGRLTGIIYDFPEIGDVLPEHVHGALDNHISIVAAGSFEEIVSRVIYRAPVVLDWTAGVPHGFKALEENSRLVQVTK